MLQRRLRLLQAVSLNMSMMVGIGPFITIPAILTTMGGPQAMVGWVLGAIVALADGLVWCELGAAFPGSGGTYHFFDAAYGESTVGRALKFLFVWQFLFSGPLEIATGAIGLAQYASYFAPALRTPMWNWGSVFPGLNSPVPRFHLLALGVMGIVTLMAYRRIEMAGRLVVVLWVGMLATVAWVIVAGLLNFDSRLAFDFPEGAWEINSVNSMGLGMALAIAMYDFLGYYQICYLGDEVDDASRTIPRAILISVVAIALTYLTMNISIIGVVPWREAMKSSNVASDMMERIAGPRAAGFLTLMIIWTALASTFAIILGYSRVPYASAKAGHFFRYFAATHPKGDFPHRSLLLIGGLGMLACLADLTTVITALLTSRILIQFVGQIFTVFAIRRRPEIMARLKFRMPFYPIPAVVALVGWLFVFGTSQWLVLGYGIGTLALGVAAFLIWDRLTPRRAEPER
ncbi:APC family permease [Paludisphaera borealis]|uniref:Serine/threonine exchanger SteT n=1 Tax=Paludisphaera borealis TaxID=1387353 RepID=A0A1U7CYB0_9BACT|nr:APC family permease [Paludisphaera borealis]APW63937.1 Serine/threonine exchanger SteT [Paludisphaera borealis]